MFRIQECLEWRELATFVPNKKLPVYNWFYYKEGFSRDLVLELIRMFNIKEEQTVLDPFCGVGTTLLASQESGINSIGFDVHPVSVFVSKTKTDRYDLNELKCWSKKLFSEKFEKPDISCQPPLVKKAFKKETLEDAVFFRNKIMFIPSEKTRNFLMLALMNSAVKASYIYKDGAVIKIRKKPVPPLRKFFQRTVNKMLRDLKNFQRKESKTFVDFGDARKLRIDNESIDAVITSPPYLNKIEYSKVYEIEQKLFLDLFQEKPALRSYIGIDTDINEINRNLLEYSDSLPETLPPEAKPYFLDLIQVTKELYRICKKGAKLGIVIGNGCFPHTVVDSDIILCKIAKKTGFKVKKLLVLNKRWCTKNRTKKVGITRESLLLWEK